MNEDQPARTLSREINLQLVATLADRLSLDTLPTHTAAAGTILVQTGDVVERLPFVRRGLLHAVLRQSVDDGNEVIAVSWGDGELGVLSYLFSDRALTVDLVAAEELVFSWVPVPAVEEVLGRQDEPLVLLVQFLVQRLREVQERERVWLARGVHERVCASLARIAAPMRTRPDGHVVMATTHEALASRCAVSRPRLSKELKRLEDEGRLVLGRGTIEIVDRTWFEQAQW